METEVTCKKLEVTYGGDKAMWCAYNYTRIR